MVFTSQVVFWNFFHQKVVIPKPTSHRENGGTLGTVPLIINPIYTLYSGYLLGISPFKGLLGGLKQRGYHPKGTSSFPMNLRCSRSEGGDRETHADGHLSNNRVFETDAGSAPVRGTQPGGWRQFCQTREAW